LHGGRKILARGGVLSVRSLPGISPDHSCRGGREKIIGDYQIIREGLIEKARISFPQLGEAQEYPLDVLKAFVPEDD
jgi:hypothetical protein